MDDFREWLSDNLRYFMLGGGILLIVLILFFGIRACTGKNDSGSGPVTTNTDNSQNTDGNSGSGSAGVTLQQADPPVRSLIDTYYKALGDKDLESLRSIVLGLSSDDEVAITNAKDYLQGYQVQEVYQVNGPTEGTYVAYANTNVLYKDVSTAEPVLSSFYIITDADGSLKIDGRNDPSVDSYMSSLEANADVTALSNKVRAAKDSAISADPALASFLDSMGQGGSSSSGEVQESVRMRANSDCNVRASASTEGDVLGICDEGTEVTVLGSEGDWTKVNYNGQTGYIFSSLLDAI